MPSDPPTRESNGKGASPPAPEAEGKKKAATSTIGAELMTCDARRILGEACAKHADVKEQVRARIEATSDSAAAADAAALRSAFRSGLTRPAAWRRQQLRALLAMLREGREALLEGMRIDMNRDHATGYFMELNMVEHAAQHALDHLDEWMALKSVGTNLVNLPGSSALKSEPFGTVLIVGCWNYPLLLALDPLVGAIAAGNAALLKVPSDMVPRTSAALVELCKRYLDTKAIKTLGGGIKVNQALLKERWDKIFYTGSTNVGKIVYQAAAEHLTPVTLEMGGKSPTIVGKTSNIDVAAKRIAWGRYTNAGQTCVSPDHVFVHRDVADKFVKKIKEAITEFYGEDPRSSEFYCRLINERHTTRVGAMVTEHKDKVRHGGAVDVSGRYIEPTLLMFGSDWKAFEASKSMGEEIFGPVLPVAVYDDHRTVVDFVNNHEKPLTLYVFSNDKTEIDAFLHETSSGAYGVNEVVTYLSNHELPFGGVGHSGLGRYHGRFSFDCFSHLKAVMQRPDATIFDIPARYPPYTSWKVTLLGAVQAVRPAWQFRALRYAMLALLVVLLWGNRKQAASWLHWLIDFILG